MIDGKTQLVGIIGWPVGHSLSPRLHNACFDALGMNWRYVPLPVRPADVGAAVKGLAALGMRGVNVTVPHKVAVTAHLDEVDELGRDLGAVNTIVAERYGENTRLKGYNTDMHGFLAGLREAGVESCRGKNIVLAGAGGAARAVLAALVHDEAAEVAILNRSEERARALAQERQTGDTRIQTAALEQTALRQACAGAHVLVNATSLGMHPHAEVSIWDDRENLPSGLVVYDLVYSPIETRLLAQARRSGAQAVDGLSMLIHQAALAFALWTGIQPPLDVMRKAALEDLGGR